MRNDSLVGVNNGNDLGAMLAGIQKRFANGKVFVAVRLKHDRKNKKIKGSALSPRPSVLNSMFCRSIQIDCRRTLLGGEISFQFQIQNHAARRINFRYREREICGNVAENLLLLQMQNLF